MTYGSNLAAWPLSARAQQPEHVRRIGVLPDANSVRAILIEFMSLRPVYHGCEHGCI
jgi:hypothetical protein